MTSFVNGHRSHSHQIAANESIHSMNISSSSTRAQRIRAAIFPEVADRDTNHGYALSSTAVQKLSEPSQLLKNAVIDIINYKDDADITEKALPELIRLLNDNDTNVAGQAALILHSLAKKEASRSAISTASLVQALNQSVGNPRANDDMRRGVAGILHCLSRSSQGRLVLLKGTGIAILVKLLEYVKTNRLISSVNTFIVVFLVHRWNQSLIMHCRHCIIFSCNSNIADWKSFVVAGVTRWSAC
jgi:hypothetical protein